MFEITGTKDGLCPLCRGKASKEKELFVVKGPYNGDICADHLYVLAQQQNGRAKQEAPLFDNARA